MTKRLLTLIVLAVVLVGGGIFYYRSRHAAQATAAQAEAALKSAQAMITQARAALNQNQVNLGHTIITAPIDGIVISRSVDVGQTVAASMQAPTLFVIAADLTKMQVNANIDESDVGRMRPGQTVHFRVDAYPTDQFIGTVHQVRLNPTTVQNVVTYSTLIDVPNPDLRLKPGMTANVNIEIARKSNVLRVPNAALRFRPTRDTFVALNQEITPDIERALGGGRGGFGRGGRGNAQAGQPGQPVRSTPARPGQAPQPPGTATAGQAAAAQGETQSPRGTATAGQIASGSNRPGDQQGQPRAQGSAAAQDGGSAFQRGGGDVAGGRGGNMDPEERRRRMEERLAQMTPEERAAFEQRMRERQAQGGSGGGQGQGNAQGGPGQNPQNADAGNRTPQRGQQQAAKSSRSMTSTGASTIDSLFGPLPTVETRGRAWLYMNKQLKPVNLRLGISDGTYTDILDGNEIQPGTEVVTNIVTGAEPTQRPGGNTTGNPLLQQPGRPGGPGGFGGGGRGGRG